MDKEQNKEIGNEICKGVAAGIQATEYFYGELMHELIGRAALPWVRFGIQNTGITRLDFEEGEVLKIRYVNRVTHLTPELTT